MYTYVSTFKCCIILFRLSWYEQVMREENHVTRKAMNMNVEGWKEEIDQKKWIDCVRQDVREKAVSDEKTSDRGEWRERTCYADPQ
jgi:hypothetical protein